MFARSFSSPWRAWPALLVTSLAVPLACFDPPDRAVQFRCESMGADACPSGYRCEADGCCHRAGSDLEANWNACYIADPGNTGTTAASSTSSSSTTEGLTTEDPTTESSEIPSSEGAATGEQDTEPEPGASSSDSSGA